MTAMRNIHKSISRPSWYRWVIICAWLFITVGCAQLKPKLDPPQVRIEKIQLLENTGLSQGLRFTLAVTNPNKIALPIDGLSYQVSLNGFQVMTGATSSVPNIKALSESMVDVDASISLLQAVGLLSSLANSNAEPQLSYDLQAKVSVRGWFTDFPINKQGLVPLFGDAPKR
jgi:LEA14-like dessication related protein